MIKKISILLAVLLACFTFAAYEGILIDFNVLGGYENDADEQFKMLYNGRWNAKLNSSANFVINRTLTYCKNVPVKGTITEKNGFVGGQGDGSVLGVRVNFPESDYNAFAEIKPKFEVESYGGEDGNKFVNKGLLKNVGAIKTIMSFVKGKNFPHAFYVNLKDQDDIESSYFISYLNYDGWAEKSWENMNYLSEVRDRQLISVPLYPRVKPLVKLSSFVIQRDGAAMAKDFVAYIGWIKLAYDKAIIEDEDDDIDDEAIWQIETDKSNLKAKLEKERLNRTSELEMLELKKMNDPSVMGNDEEATGETEVPANNQVAPQ